MGRALRTGQCAQPSSKGHQESELTPWHSTHTLEETNPSVILQLPMCVRAGERWGDVLTAGDDAPSDFGGQHERAGRGKLHCAALGLNSPAAAHQPCDLEQVRKSLRKRHKLLVISPRNLMYLSLIHI